MEKRTSRKLLLLFIVAFMGYTSLIAGNIAHQNQPLNEVLDQIGKNYQVIITYNSRLLADMEVKFEFMEGEQLETAVNRALVKTGLKYKQLTDKYYIVFKENKSRQIRKIQRNFKKIQKLEKRENLSVRQNSGIRMLDVDYVIQSAEKLLEEKVISGKITDQEGEPLIGATVIAKGTSMGTISDIDGNYTISVSDDVTTLEISYIGMKTMEVDIGSQTTINVVMEVDALGLEEVVVVGYGTMRKSDLTGSVERVKMEDYENSASSNIIQAIQGYLPGVNVGASAVAGGEPNFTIRGQTSLNGLGNPLIVLDGIIFNGSVNDINLKDVATIDILKDASAAAVYGSRSANGVIIITTKRGKTSKPTINVSASTGLGDISPTKRTDIMDAEQYAVRLTDYYYQRDLYNWYKTGPTDATSRPERPDVTDRNVLASNLRTLEEQENYLAGNEIDWLDEVLRTSTVQNYNISVSGATDKTNYYLSGSFMDQKGVLLGDDFERATIRANFENNITDWLTIKLNGAYSHRNYSGLGAEMGRVLLASPLADKYDELGNYPIDLAGEAYQHHPFANSLVTDEEIENNVFVVLSSKIKVPWIKGLSYEFNYSNTIATPKHYSFYPTSGWQGATNNGRADRTHLQEDSWLINNIVTYTRTFADKHNVNATLLYTADQHRYEESILSAIGFQNPSLEHNAMQLAGTQTVETHAWQQNTISYMGRINYSYDSKYLFTGTIRRDGDSRFGPNNKFATFPSLSVGWVASNEDFLNSQEWLDFLKFRLSYGVNGNQNAASYGSFAAMASTDYVYGSATAIGLYPDGLGNTDLKWEKTASTNFGLELKVLNNRISANFDLYNAKTTDVLVQRSLPTSSGYAAVWQNVSEIDNKGIEIGLTTVNVK
ncbi:MAG: SusC/RagA family TonB-linked outer membrane protein, partial [Bacteroidetes bacterium]|nr:SusC/RagA family TonB-linked outer membrane protein [Bacteroidota bacterium]